MLLKSIRLEIYHIIDPWNCVTVQKERLFVLHRRIKSPNATQSADRYRISRFLEYMLKRRFRTFPDWAHRDSPGVLSFFCLWLVMWSNSNSKNSTAKKSAKSKKKSAIFSRKQRISWSCYPDLNWRPHPYQRRRKNISKHKHHKTKNFRRAIQPLRRQKIAAGGPGPLFFYALQRLPALDLIPMPRRAYERRQFPRGHAPGPDSPSAGNCHGAEPTFGPALHPGHDNHPPVLSWRATQGPTGNNATLITNSSPPLLSRNSGEFVRWGFSCCKRGKGMSQFAPGYRLCRGQKWFHWCPW